MIAVRPTSIVVLETADPHLVTLIENPLNKAMRTISEKMYTMSICLSFT